MLKRKGRNSMKTITTETSFEIGAIEGNAYTNKFFSVEYTLPEGFSFCNADQLAELNAVIVETNNDQTVLEAFKSGNAFFDMAVAAENDQNVNVVVQIAGPEATSIDEAGYFEAAKDKIIDQLNDAGITVKSAEIGTYTNRKNGDEFTAIKLGIVAHGTPMLEEIICIKAGDYFMNVTATATDEVKLDFVLSHLTHIKQSG
jgi:hypothetical protein